MLNQQQTAELAPFGKYLLDEELARGGMARVFRARLRGPGGFEKRLVVKQILPELAKDPSFVELFVREANTLVQMSHPNLVPVYELGVIDGVYFLAMEWVEGATVDQLLRDGPLPESEVAQLGAQVAEALRYAHERFGIVHRDVTPRNIMVDGAGHARLLDFGIAAPVAHTGKGELFGSPGYMAPEQIRGDALGPESDLFALGCVLYEAASGRPAWPVTRVEGVLRASTSAPPPLEIEAGLRALIMRLLSTERAERPKSAGEVADSLRTWLSERHPRGVLPELGDRAQRALERSAGEPKPPSEPPPASGSGRVEVRSIAVSPALTELLQAATERMQRPTPTPAPVAEPEGIGGDPEFHRLIRRFIRDALILAVALVIAMIYGRHWATERVEEEMRVPPTDAAHARGAPSAPQDREPSQPSAAGHGAAATELVAAPPKPQPSAADPTTQPALEPAKHAGFLAVSASPWAEVHVDGHMLGTTPQRKLALRPGKHTVTLRCPPLDRQAQTNLELQPNQTLRLSVDLHDSAPQIAVK